MINKLIAKIQKTKAPIVVGLDPMLSYIPEHIQKKAFEEYGETLEGAAEAIWQFNKEIVDKTYDLIPAVKPQIAMYEQFGIEGLKAYKKTIDYCKSKDLVVIGDIKRGDIGSTSAAYAVGHLGKVQVGSKCYVPFDEDFATVNPYLGSDGVKPFIEVCQEEGKGIFVLVKTSNPSSGEFQDQLVDGRPLYELVGEKVAQWGEEHMGDSYSYVGAVVGATYPEMGAVLRKLMPKTFILVPGYGAQGGQGKDLVHFFNEDGLGAIVNSSRGIIAAYKQEKYASFGAENFGDASRAAVEDMAADIRQRAAGAVGNLLLGDDGVGNPVFQIFIGRQLPEIDIQTRGNSVGVGVSLDGPGHPETGRNFQQFAGRQAAAAAGPVQAGAHVPDAAQAGRAFEGNQFTGGGGLFLKAAHFLGVGLRFQVAASFLGCVADGLGRQKVQNAVQFQFRKGFFV